MLNVDHRILFELEDRELKLLCVIANRINGDGKAWPSNKLLLQETGWSIEKLQLAKHGLEVKGFIKKYPRNSGRRQTSNSYEVLKGIRKFTKTDIGKSDSGLSGIYENQLGEISENPIGGDIGKSDREINRSINQNEVLINEAKERETVGFLFFEIDFINLFFPKLTKPTSTLSEQSKQKVTEAARAVFSHYNDLLEATGQIQAYHDYTRIKRIERAIATKTLAETIVSQDWKAKLKQLAQNGYDPGDDSELVSGWLLEEYYDCIPCWVSKIDPEKIIFL